MRVSAPEPVGPFGVLLEIATDTGWTQQDERPEQALCSPGVWRAVCVRVCVRVPPAGSVWWLQAGSCPL